MLRVCVKPRRAVSRKLPVRDRVFLCHGPVRLGARGKSAGREREQAENHRGRRADLSWILVNVRLEMLIMLGVKL